MSDRGAGRRRPPPCRGRDPVRPAGGRQQPRRHRGGRGRGSSLRPRPLRGRGGARWPRPRPSSPAARAPCPATRGPGAASAGNGVAGTLFHRQPLLLVSDCVPAASLLLYTRSQRLDHAALFAPVTKGCFVLGSTSTADDVRKAVARSLAGPPGPVHLDLDPTGPGTPIAGRGERRSHPGRPRRGPRRTAGRSPAGRRRRRRREPASGLRGLLAGSTVPVLTTYKAKGVVPEAGPNVGGDRHRRDHRGSRSCSRRISSSASGSTRSSSSRHRGPTPRPSS